jgi:hypothetical protein
MIRPHVMTTVLHTQDTGANRTGANRTVLGDGPC